MKKTLPKPKLFLIGSIILFTVSIAQITFNLAKINQTAYLLDFKVYYLAAQEFTKGNNPYQTTYVNIPFNYPPGVLPILWLFTLLPFSVSQTIFTLISFLTFYLSLYLIIKITKIPLSLPFTLTLFAFLTQTFPVKFTLAMGQINHIALFLTILSLYLSNQSKKFSSALTLALAATTKIFPLALLPIFFIRKQYHYVITSFSLFLLINLFKPSLFTHYFFSLIPSFFISISTNNFYDQSLKSLFLRLGLTTPIIALIISLTLYFAIILATRKSTLSRAFIILLALLPLTTPVAWQHQLVFAYPLILAYYYRLPAFFLIWIPLAFHFSPGNQILDTLPVIASYQTLLILVLVFHSTITSLKN